MLKFIKTTIFIIILIPKLALSMGIPQNDPNLNFITDAFGLGGDDSNFEKIMEFIAKHKDKLDAVGKFSAEMINGIKQTFESERSRLERELREKKQEKENYENEMQSMLKLHSNQYYEKKILNIEDEIKDIQSQIKRHQDVADKTISDIRDLTLGSAKQFTHGWINEKVQAGRLAEDRKNEVRKTVAGIRAFINSLTSKDTLTRVSIMTLGLTTGLIGTYYGSKLTYNYIDSLIGKPTLIRESTRHGWQHGFKTFFTETLLGKTPEEIKLEDVILPADMAEKLKFLADDTRSTQENALPYRHVLFYGMPGTGKTMFAKRLAKYSGMDYAIMSGADFAQFKNGEDITELHKLFDWAEHSDKGLLIFIDEADAFLRDRRVLNNQGKDLLNAFLSRTGASSDKFMLVFATNYEDELDPATLSRINKKIHFPLPALEERIKIINLYVDKYIRNEERIIKRGNTQVKIKIEIQENVNEHFIQEVAQKIDGFSGREIEQMISELRMSVYNKTGGVLTRAIFNDIASDKLKEHEHDMECAKQQRARYEASLGQTQISMKEK